MIQQYCRCRKENTKIVCELPITLPTSKVRIKRLIKNESFEELLPVASRRERLGKNDFIEWQISYISNEGLVEFGFLLEEFYKCNKLKREDICQIIERLDRMKTFDESFKIQRDMKNLKKHGEFKLIVETTPILRLLLSDGCFIDVVIRHKQRAVGYQAMVFIYIPVHSNCLKSKPPLIGRTASKGEVVEWYPSEEHVLGLLRAFLIASETHRRDIKAIVRNRLNIECY